MYSILKVLLRIILRHAPKWNNGKTFSRTLRPRGMIEKVRSYLTLYRILIDTIVS